MKPVSEMTAQEIADASAEAMWAQDNASQGLGSTLR